MSEVQISIDNPKTLVDICLECLVLNNDYVNGDAQATLSNMPTTIRQLILDKILELESRVIDDENYSKILDHRTREVFMKEDTCKVQNISGLLVHLHEHCKNVIKINLSCLRFDYGDYDMTIVGETLASMVHLEHIDLDGSTHVTDHCLECIGLKCHKLKYLSLNQCEDITDYGIRALCDPSTAPYGNCSELTQVYLERCYGEELRGDEVSWNGMSLLLQHCPNLEILSEDQNVFGVAIAILELTGSNSPVWNANDSEGGFAVLFPRFETLTLDRLLELRTFKLKSLDLSSFEYPDRFLSEILSQAIGRFCPLLENLKMTLPIPRTFSLCGFLHLPLKSLTIYGKAWKYDYMPQPMCTDVIRLLQSVGSSLHTLYLEDQTFFDLRVISRECPNLTHLTLSGCDTSSDGAIWPNCRVGELESATFNSLTKLVTLRNIISDENFVALLSSPNLEVVMFEDAYMLDDDDSVHESGDGPLFSHCVPAIQQTLLQCSEAFSKVRKVDFTAMCIDLQFLSDFVDRAVVLESLTVEDCFSMQNGRRVYFEYEHVRAVIRKEDLTLSVDFPR